MIKTGSDFSGVGAFDQALIRLNIPYKTVFACDMDKFARQTYIANYGEPDYYPENVSGFRTFQIRSSCRVQILKCTNKPVIQLRLEYLQK